MATSTIRSPHAQLFGYGLLFGGAAICGKLMIDALVGDMDAAKTRREFIGPVEEKRAASSPALHGTLSDLVRFFALGFSVYSMLAEAPKLVSQWGQVQATVRELTK